MTTALELLLAAIDQLPDKSALRSQLAPTVRDYFAAQRSGIFFFDQLVRDRRFQTVLDFALSIDHNPIARYIVSATRQFTMDCLALPKLGPWFVRVLTIGTLWLGPSSIGVNWWA